MGLLLSLISSGALELPLAHKRITGSDRHLEFHGLAKRPDLLGGLPARLGLGGLAGNLHHARLREEEGEKKEGQAAP